MNTMRVYLHDLLYQQDSAGFMKRLGRVLEHCQKAQDQTSTRAFRFLLGPVPEAGQAACDPKPGVHNSGWVQSPGFDALKDSPISAFGKICEGHSCRIRERRPGAGLGHLERAG
jgi:hypothetical protein